jgi:hypothetical protein
VVDAIAVQPDKGPSFCADNRMPEPRDLLRICSTLVVCIRRPIDDNEDDYSDSNILVRDGRREVNELRLAHFSIKEYLISHCVVQSFAGHLAETTARARIATICLTYLRDLDHGLSSTQIRAKFYFAQYCARYWVDHAQTAEEIDGDLQGHIMQFYEDEETAYVTCYNLYDPDRPWLTSIQRRNDDVAQALYHASLSGLVVAVTRLLDQGADINAQGGKYGNALQVASVRGHEKIVQILLGKDAAVNAHGGEYGNALQAASDRGRDKIVQMLLDAGADVNAQGGEHGSALQAASYRGHDKIVQMLLDVGADVNGQGRRYGNALQAASHRGHDKTVQMLLDAGADVNAQGGEYGSALQAASHRGHDKIVQMLLDAGADVNAQGGEYGSALPIID